MTDKILELAKHIEDDLIKYRRQIHANPELGYEETETAKLISETLKSLDIEVLEKVGGTGVVGIIRGRNPGKTVMLRSDMDALKMLELNEVSYKSKNPGKMHACGHDGHVSWLLGAAMILKEMEKDFDGTVKLVFQPAEEGLGGAGKMIEDGVLENPKVDAALGAHIWPNLDSGFIGVKYDGAMAAPTMFNIKIVGRGGHGAEPHLAIDPISIGCQVYMALQTIVSRMTNPTEPVVLSITQFNGGTAHNVIPNEVLLAGTVRTVTDTMADKVQESMKAIVEGLVKANGADCEFDYNTYYPAVINDKEMVDLLIGSAGKIVGQDKVTVFSEPSMGGEDFSFYQQKVPGVFFMVGTRNEQKGIIKPLHNPSFNLDEEVLVKASTVMVQAALDFLES